MAILVTTEAPYQNDMEGWWEDLTEDCRLMNFETWQAKVSAVLVVKLIKKTKILSKTIITSQIVEVLNTNYWSCT